MKKLIYIFLVFLILLILYSCNTFDNGSPPIFLEEPLIDLSGRGLPDRAGEVYNVSINVTSDSTLDLDRIDFYLSGDSSPFKSIKDINRKNYNDIYSFHLPHSAQRKSINLIAYDVAGNSSLVTSIKEKSSRNIFRFQTRSAKPDLRIFPRIIELNTNGKLQRYIYFELEKIGEKVSSIRVILNNEHIPLKSVDTNLTNLHEISSEINEEAFFINIQENYWRFRTIGLIKADYPPGEYSIDIDAEGKYVLEGEGSRKITIEPEDDLYEEDLSKNVNIIFKSNLIPEERYEITIEASSKNYIKEIRIDGFRLFPENNEQSRQFVRVRRQGLRAPSRPSNTPITHRIVVETFTDVYEKTIELFVKEDEPPVIEYFEIYKITHDASPVNIKDDNVRVFPNDLLRAKFKVKDDIGFTAERTGDYNGEIQLIFGRHEMVSFNAFQNYEGRQFNQYIEDEYDFTAFDKNFEITLKAIDRSENTIERKALINISDKEAPEIKRVNLINENNREISGEKLFNVAINNEIRFRVEIESNKRRKSPISLVEVTIYDTEEATVLTQRRISGEDLGYVAITQPHFIIPNKEELSFDLRVVDASGNETIIENYQIKIFENEEEIYVPRIKTNNINKLIVPGVNAGPFVGTFSDDGLLKYVRIQIYEIRDGAEHVIRLDDGTIDPTSYVQAGSDDNPLNINFRILTLDKWQPKADGSYRVNFYAKNTLNYTNQIDVDLDVENISIRLVNPPNLNIYAYGRDIDLEINTVVESINTVYIYYDSDNDGEYNQLMFEKTYEFEDINPQGIISDLIRTTNYDIFPNTGRYKIKVIRDYSDLITEDEVEITLGDQEPYQFSQNGVILEGENVGERAKYGYYNQTANIYYLPIKYDEGVNNLTDIKLEFIIEGYSILNEAVITINNKEYYFDSEDIEIIEEINFRKRKYRIETIISSGDIRIAHNNMNIIMNNTLNVDLNNNTEKNINLFTIGTEKPKLNEFRIDIRNKNQTDSSESLSYTHNDYNRTENIINDTLYDFRLREIFFEDVYGMTGIEFYWLDNRTKEIIPIRDRNVGNENRPLTVSTNIAQFGGGVFDILSPENVGSFNLVIKVKNENYSIVEDRNLPEYMNVLKELNSEKIELNFIVGDVLDLVGNIIFDEDKINNRSKGFIDSRTVQLYLAIQKIDDLDIFDFEVIFKQGNVEVKRNTQGNFTTENDPRNANVRLNPVSIRNTLLEDGPAEITVIFENTRGEKFETKENVIIDLIRPENREISEPEFDPNKREIFAEIRADFKLDIDDIFFEIKDKEIIGKNVIKQEIIGNTIRLSFNVENFYPGIYDIRLFLKDKNSNIFISPYNSINIIPEKTVIKDLNYYGLHKRKLALRDDYITIFNKFGFDELEIELDGKTVLVDIEEFETEQEYTLESTLLNNLSENKSIDVRVVNVDKENNFNFQEFKLFNYNEKYIEEGDLEYNKDFWYSNKNTGLNPLRIEFDSNIKIKRVHVELDQTIFDLTNINYGDNKTLPMNQTSTENVFEIYLPKLEENLEQNEMDIKIEALDISNYATKLNIKLNFDTKPPIIDDFKLLLNNVEVTAPVSFNNVSNLRLDWNLTDENIDNNQKGKVYVVINGQYFEVTGDTKTGGEYSFPGYSFLRNNEYEIFVEAVDEALNKSFSDKITLKVQ